MGPVGTPGARACARREPGTPRVMSSPKSLITRKAAKAVIAHSAHGSVSKVKRRPVRSGLLLAAGGALGAVAGFLLGRRSAPGPGAAAAARDDAPETSAGAPRPVAAVPDEAARAAGSATSVT